MNQPITSTINFKAEPWKYTPKKFFKAPSPLSAFKENTSDLNRTLMGLGPSEEQFQAVSFGDFTTDKIVHKTLDPNVFKSYFTSKNNTTGYLKRASLDSTLSNELSDFNTESLNLTESLPTTLWINTNSLSPKFLFDLSENTAVSMCLFESDQSVGLKQEINFIIKKGAKLNVGLDLNSTVNSYRQMSFILEEKAEVNFFSFSSGQSDFKRLEVRAYQFDKNSKVTLNGLSITKDDAVFDFHSDVFHFFEDQETIQTFKTLNEDIGHSIFSGRVHLTEDSTGANVEQLNNNLLLGKKSKVDTQPELNIYQDDVKASHGATTGALDESHFFYLMSRGFSKKAAKKILLEGFLLSPLDVFKENKSLKKYFETRIKKGL